MTDQASRAESIGPSESVASKAAPDSTGLAWERTRTAAERTLLAWVRTSLALISFGFGLDRLFGHLATSEKAHSLERAVGMALVVLGVAVMVAALVEHRWLLRRIGKRETLSTGTRWSIVTSTGFMLIAIGAVALVLMLL